jgi:hypothetical protein
VKQPTRTVKQPTRTVKQPTRTGTGIDTKNPVYKASTPPEIGLVCGGRCKYGPSTAGWVGGDILGQPRVFRTWPCSRSSNKLWLFEREGGGPGVDQHQQGCTAPSAVKCAAPSSASTDAFNRKPSGKARRKERPPMHLKQHSVQGPASEDHKMHLQYLQAALERQSGSKITQPHVPKRQLLFLIWHENECWKQQSASCGHGQAARSRPPTAAEHLNTTKQKPPPQQIGPPQPQKFSPLQPSGLVGHTGGQDTPDAGQGGPNKSQRQQLAGGCGRRYGTGSVMGVSRPASYSGTCC